MDKIGKYLGILGGIASLLAIGVMVYAGLQSAGEHRFMAFFIAFPILVFALGIVALCLVMATQIKNHPLWAGVILGLTSLFLLLVAGNYAFSSVQLPSSALIACTCLLIGIMWGTASGLAFATFFQKRTRRRV